MKSELFPSLDSSYFPRVGYSRSLQVKIKGRWNTIASFLLTNATCQGRHGMSLQQWPEFAEVCKAYPQGTEFRFTYTASIVPYLSVLHDIKIGRHTDVTLAEQDLACTILLRNRYYS